jgi:hypothetical protein
MPIGKHPVSKAATATQTNLFIACSPRKRKNARAGARGRDRTGMADFAAEGF